MAPVHPGVRRIEVTQATVDRFRDMPFKWGTRDCARMVAHHLRHLGYKVRLPPSGSYASRRSAIKAMRAAGYDSLATALDQLGLARIAPAAALPGDIIELPGDTDLGALTIAVGNKRLFGYHAAADGATIMQPLEYVAAWRAEPQ